MVITKAIHNYDVKRILVDQGHSIDILYDHITRAIQMAIGSWAPDHGILIGLFKKHVPILGSIS